MSAALRGSTLPGAAPGGQPLVQQVFSQARGFTASEVKLKAAVEVYHGQTS